MCRNSAKTKPSPASSKSMSSYLKDGKSGKIATDSSVIAVLSTLAVIGIFSIIMGFVIIRNRNAGSFLEVVTGPLKQSRNKINKEKSSKGIITSSLMVDYCFVAAFLFMMFSVNLSLCRRA